ncbi:MAG TPA: response regulator [Candidatus Dormibacteraeota bacterium]|nr:response regulator [Candidatus Dormibacteraeota bacterium]
MAKTILLVDDSATSRMMSRMLLGNMKEYEILSACDGTECVEVALQRRPDLILMDVEMPRMSGIEACRALREHAATRKTPIVLLTMRGESKAVKTGFDSGCNEYLLKPLNEAVLVAILKKYLG